MKNRKDMRKTIHYIILIFWCTFPCIASGPIKSVQYWFDDNFNGRAALNIAANQSVQITELNTDALPAGIHQLRIRAKDNDRWSVVHSQMFYKLPVITTENSLTSYEYWIDNDFAQRSSGTLSGASAIISELNINNCSVGTHMLHIRAKDSRGNYSPVYNLMFYRLRANTEPNAIVNYEYWLDNGFDNRTSVAASGGTLTITSGLDIDALSQGIHVIYIRAKDSQGYWSGAHAQPFYLQSITPVGGNKITAYRYWFDDRFDNFVLKTLPQGAATYELKEKLTLPANFNENEKHAFHIQFQTTTGQWSVAATDSFKLVPLFTEEEFDLLKTFYRSTNGGDWLNTQAGVAVWDTTDIAGVRDWYGIDFEDGSVSRFNLTKNNLTGMLPGVALSGFPNLQALTVDSNSVSLEEALPAYLVLNIKAQEFDCGDILAIRTASLNLPIYDISRYAHSSGTFTSDNRFNIYVNSTYLMQVSASNDGVTLEKSYVNNLNTGDLLRLVQHDGDAVGAVYTYRVTFDDSVTNAGQAEIRLYPNPVSEGFFIGGIRETAMLTLIDVSGKTLLSKSVNDNEYLPINSLAKGMYIVRLHTGKETVEKKIIKL
jgi:hypothetical protein